MDHRKSDCPHKNARCERCGRTGHLEVACWQGDRQKGEEGPARVAAAPREEQQLPKRTSPTPAPPQPPLRPPAQEALQAFWQERPGAPPPPGVTPKAQAARPQEPAEASRERPPGEPREERRQELQQLLRAAKRKRRHTAGQGEQLASETRTQERQRRRTTSQGEQLASQTRVQENEAAPAGPQTVAELEASLSPWDRLLLQRTACELAQRHENRLSQHQPPLGPMG